MNIPALASDIAQRVPEMHRDSTINNANLIENLLNESMAKQKYDYDALLATIQLLKAQNELLKRKIEQMARKYDTRSTKATVSKRK